MNAVRRSVLGLTLGLFMGVGGANGQSPGVDLRAMDWNRYRAYDEVTAVLRALERNYPHLASVQSAGKSTITQRDIWVITVTNTATGPHDAKPAHYLDGGTHDSEVTGPQTALYTAWYAVTAYGTDPEITELLDTRTLYIMPYKDVDGTDLLITGRIPYDLSQIPERFTNRCTDRPSDITGNGYILQMRIPDPDGGWEIHDRDSRIMIPRRQGSTGPFFRLMAEGVDDNGDGVVNSDPCPRLSTNRNYPVRWGDDMYTRRGTGDYPLQENETRAVVEFAARHPNIAVMEALHTHAGVILRPFCNLPDDKMPEIDRAYYDVIAQRGREITNYGYLSVFEGLTPDTTRARYGVQLDWGYLGLGVFAFTTEIWRYMGNIGPTAEWEAEPREETEERLMARNDSHFGGRHFINWKPFDHPQLGPVEIGGWIQEGNQTPVWRNPPASILESEIRPVAMWILHQASVTPLVRVRNVDVAAAGPGNPSTEIERLTVTIANEGFAPTNVTQHALDAGIAKPVIARISMGPGVTLTGGSRQVELGHLEGTPPVVQPLLWRSRRYGGNNTRTVEWTVTGTGQVTVEVISEKGGRHAKTIDVGSARVAEGI
jgi:hypothetical protein